MPYLLPEQYAYRDGAGESRCGPGDRRHQAGRLGACTGGGRRNDSADPLRFCRPLLVRHPTHQPSRLGRVSPALSPEGCMLAFLRFRVRSSVPGRFASTSCLTRAVAAHRRDTSSSLPSSRRTARGFSYSREWSSRARDAHVGAAGGWRTAEHVSGLHSVRVRIHEGVDPANIYRVPVPRVHASS